MRPLTGAMFPRTRSRRDSRHVRCTAQRLPWWAWRSARSVGRMGRRLAEVGWNMTSQSSPFDGVVLDLSGVVITPVSTALDELAGWHRVPVETMVAVLMGPRGWSTSDHPWHLAERGELAVSALQDQIVPFATAAGLTMRGDEYARLLSADFVVNDDVLDRITTLRTAGFTIGLLMNSFRELRSRVESRIDFGMFDAVVDSCEVGCRKPEPEIFDIMTQALGVHPSRIVYLDDVAAN